MGGRVGLKGKWKRRENREEQKDGSNEEYGESNLGKNKWKKMLTKAGCDESFFFLIDLVATMNDVNYWQR